MAFALLLGQMSAIVHPASAAVGINKTLNFQGKVVNTDGTNVPDSTYSFVFSIYTVSSGGSAVWTEAQNLTTVNGIFQARLGAVTSLPGSVDFNTDNIYLGMNFNSNGEMNPRVQFSSVAQAFNSEKVGGIASTSLARNDAANTFTLGDQTISRTSVTAFQIQKASAADILLNANTTDNRLVVGNATGTDTDTTLLVLDSATADPTTNLVEGAQYYNSSTDKFRCYQASAWTDCISSAGSVTMQATYDNTADATPEIVLTAAQGALSIQDATSALGTNLLEVTSNGGGATYFAVSATGPTVGADKAITVIGGTTANRPAGTTEGQIFYDQTLDQMLIYSNGKWQADRTTATKIVAASNSLNKEKADYVANGDTAAAGDGDQVEINQALTALTNGGIVVLLEGTYTIDATIAMGTNKTLSGSGGGTLIQLSSNVNSAMDGISGTSLNNVTLMNFKLDGNKAGITAGIQEGIEMNSIGSGSGGSAVTGAKISKVTVQNFEGDGIEIIGSGANSTITNTIVRGNVGRGIDAADGNLVISDTSVQGNDIGINITDNNVTVSDSLIEGNTNHGIYISGETIAITGSNIKSNGDGGVNEGNITVTDNKATITGNTISLGNPSGITTIVGDFNTITGNTIFNNVGFGINLGSDDNIVSGNNSYRNTDNIAVPASATSGTGILISGVRNTVTGNTFRENDLYGINLSGNNATVTGNVISASALNGMYVDTNASNNVISSNSVVDNGTRVTSSVSVYIRTGANNNQVVGNKIVDAAGTGCGIDFITSSPPTGTYLADNGITVPTGVVPICNVPTGTIYGGQLDSSNNNNDYVLQGSRTVINQDTELMGTLNSAYGGIGQFGNLLTFSEQFDNAIWVKSGVTNPTANTIVAPDLLTTAETLVGTGNSNVQQTHTTSTNGTYTFSVWLKSAGTVAAGLRIDSTGATPTTGTVKAITTSTSWTRYFVTQTFTGTPSNLKVVILPGNGVTGTVQAWGAQLIVGSGPGAYAEAGSTIVATSLGLVSNASLLVQDTITVNTLGGTTGAVAICRNSSNQISTCGTNSAGVTLQHAYDASTSPELVLDATRGALTVQDAAAGLGSNANLLEVKSGNGSVTLLAVKTGSSAGSFVGGQNGIVQNFDIGGTTAGTTRGYQFNSTITNATNAATNIGFEINQTDNASTLGNTNTGLKVTLAGSNVTQAQTGIDVSATNGTGVKISVTGNGGNNLCSGGGSSYAWGACILNTSTGSGAGIYSSTTTSDSSIGSLGGAGVVGVNVAPGVGGNYYSGVTGRTLTSAAAGYTSVGVQGVAKAGAGATIYGGYFTLDSGSGATLGSALYSSNSTIGASILQLQDNTTDVLTVANGGATIFKNETNSATAFQIQSASAAQTLFSANTVVRAAGTAGNMVLIGDSTGTDLDTTILKLDATTANPTTNLASLNGGLFYNSTTNKVSVVENGAVKVLCNTTDLACGAGGGSTLQQAYDASSSPATILLSAADDNILFQNPASGGTDIAAAPVLKIENLATGNVEGLRVESAGTGNLFTVRDTTATAQDVFKIADGGATTFRNQTNSTNAFQIQTAAGATALNINTATTPNLVANSNFETGTNDWLGKGSATISTDGVNAQFGTQSLKIVTTAAANDGARYHGYTLEASTQYTLSLYAKLSTGSSSNITIGHQAVSGTDVNSCASQSLTTTWTRYTCTFTTGGTITPPSQIFIKQSDAAIKTIYIDGVQLEEAATASAYNNQAVNLQVETATNTIILNGGNSGELGAWRTSRNVIPSARGEHSSVVANGYVYIIGGTIGGAYQSTVYYAKLNADGSVGSMQTNVKALPAIIGQHSSAVFNGYVYVIGGYNGTSNQSTVYYAKLNADGSIGSWQTSINALPAASRMHSSVVANGHVYVLGGFNPSSSNIVYYAKLNTDGSIGNWITSANAMPASLTEHSSLVANGYVYVIGGTDSSPQSTIHYAKLNADGTMGAWSTNATNPLPNVRAGHTSVIANGYVYVAGGYDVTTNEQDTVYYAKLNDDGTTGTWGASANPLPGLRSNHASVVANGYVYVIGGENAATLMQSTVFYASTSRLQIGGSVDLVGSGGQNLSEGGTGGSLTAGNTKVVGSLEVQDLASFATGVGIGGNLSVSGSTTLKGVQGSSDIVKIQNAGGVSLINANTVNAVGNSSFETGTVNIDNGVDGWTKKLGSETSLKLQSSQAQFGAQSMEVVTTTTTQQGAKAAAALKPSTQYTLSFYAKVSAGSFSALTFGRSDTGSGETNCVTNGSMTTTFARFTCTFTTGAGATSASYIYISKGADASVRTIYIDGVQLETAAAATDFRNGDFSVDAQTSFRSSSNSATAFQIQNSTGATILAVDTSGSQVLLGKAGAGGIDGKLVFNNAAGANTVTLQAPGSNPASSFALALPTTAGAANECLKNTATPGTLTYGTCGGGSLKDSYDADANGGDAIIDLTSTDGGILIRDTAGGLGSNLFAVQNNGSSATYLGVTASAATFQDAAGNNGMVFDSTTSTLRVYENIASPTNYASISYANGAAIFAASSGTTQIGSGAGGGGNINLLLTGTADQLLASKTNTLAAAYAVNDFQFTRNLTATSFAVTGNVMTIEDLTTFSTGSSAPNVLYVNQNNTSATGNLIVAQTGGSVDRFKVSTAGNATLAGGVTIGSGASYTGAGAVTLQSAASTSLTITGNAASTFSTSSGALTLTSAAAATWSTTTGNLTLLAGGASTIVLKPGTDSTSALQIQNAAGSSLLSFDSSTTSGERAGILSVGVVDGDATLLVLDTKNDNANDPTGSNGAMYYNSNTGRFRCYENSIWKNCISSWVTVNKTSDEVINSDATLNDDNTLSFATTANTKYHVRLRAFYHAGTAAADFKYRMSHSGTTTSVIRNITNAAGNDLVAEQALKTAFDATDVALTDTVAQQNIIYEDIIVAVGASGGTLSFQWAQNTSTAGANTTVYAGSILEYDQL